MAVFLGPCFLHIIGLKCFQGSPKSSQADLPGSSRQCPLKLLNLGASRALTYPPCPCAPGLLPLTSISTQG